MKVKLLFFSYFTAYASLAQTAIIAHKSHSGSAVDFFIDPYSNFGEPPPRLIQVIRLNDTAAIKVYDNRNYDVNTPYYFDTIYKSPIYSKYDLNIDSMKKDDYYNSNVEYIHFKNSPDSLKEMKPPKQIQQAEIGKNIPVNNLIIQPVKENTPRKKKKSYLLFLFGITGGGMLLIKLFGKSKVSHNSIV